MPRVRVHMAAICVYAVRLDALLPLQFPLKTQDNKHNCELYTEVKLWYYFSPK